MSILFYRRPDYVDKAPGYLNDSSCQRYVERTKGSKHKPPAELSFDNILNNRTLPPTTLGDFMDYLMYVAHDAESLQFFLWYRDYVRRFNALSAREKGLSSEWKFDSSNTSPAGWPFAQDDKEIAVSSTTPADRPIPARSFSRLGQQAPHISMQGLPTASPDFEGFPQPPPNASSTGLTALPVQERNKIEDDAKSYVSRSSKAHQDKTSMRATANGANPQAGLKWKGFSIQPFRDECTRIISHYLAPQSPRELNLAHSTRASVLHALQHTTHPSAFLPAVQLIETQLRHQSHPNFIRWSICNGNAPKIFFVRTVGVANTALGFVIAILLVLSHASRWWRIFAAPIWFGGIATLVAAYKGLCVVLHNSHTRNLKPWEDPGASYSQFTEDVDNVHAGANPGSSMNLTGSPDMNSNSAYDSLEKARTPSNDYTSDNFVFGSGNEEYVHAEWMDNYKKKSVLRKIFETSVKVQDQTITVLQDRIARQSQIWALILTVILTVVFVAIPKGNFY